jgi:hypothetical protein
MALIRVHLGLRRPFMALSSSVRLAAFAAIRVTGTRVMLEAGETIAVQFFGASKDNRLRRGVITAAEGASWTVEFSVALAPQVGEAVLVYYQEQGKRVRLGGKVEAFLRSAPLPVIRLVVGGDAEPAENRQAFRVPTAGANLWAEMPGGVKAALFDVSAEGFAVVAEQRYEVGSAVQTRLSGKSGKFAGRARVQNVTEMEDGRFRCGLTPLRGETELAKGLRLVWMEVQRDHLRRETRA